MRYIGQILFSDERMNCKLFHIKYHHNQDEVEQVLFRVKSADLGLRDSRLRDRPMVPFILLNTSLRCSLNDKRLSSIIPR